MKIANIVFPQNQGYRYYNMHYKYILSTINYAGLFVTVNNSVIQNSGASFQIRIDNRMCCIDFYDFTDLITDYEKFDYYFKFHFTEGIHEKYKIYPISPISFDDWHLYAKLKDEIHYTASSDLILNKQNTYKDQVKYRVIVQKLLKEQYGQYADINISPQIHYWRMINNCLTAVFVPGARQNMLDRAQFQFIAFGACTISPRLATILPYYQKLLPGVHYIECQLDYTDLIEKIEWCKSNREKCKEIGQNAKNFFEQFCTPEKIWDWISEVIYD